MGILTYLFDNEWAQRSDIELTKRRLEHQSRVDREARRRLRRGMEARIDDIEDDVAELALFVRTLMRVLTEKGVIDRAAFVEAARAVDASDGTEDGRYTGPVDAP